MNTIKREHNKLKNQNTKYKKGKIFTIVYLTVLLISFFKIYPYIFDKKLNLNGDNANYYVLGAALSQGQGYKNIHLSPSSPANHYPPGYPVIVAATMKFISTDVETIKSVNGFFLLLSVIALFYLFYKITDNIHLSFILSLFILLNSNLLEFSTIMMSEMSFLFFSIVSLFLLIKTDLRIPVYKNLLFFLLIIMVATSYYIRSAGLSLVGGIILVFVLKKNWKYLVTFIIGFIALALPWYIRGNNLGGNSYLNSLFWKNPYRTELGKMNITDWFERIYNNFARYLTREIPNVTINAIDVVQKDPISGKEWIVGLIIVGLIIFGLLKLKKYRFIIFSYLLGSFGIMLLWPDVWFGTRFVLPIAPLLVFLIGMGIYSLLRIICKQLKVQNQFITSLAIPLSFLAFLPLFTPEIHELHKKALNVYPKNYKNYFELAKWANQNTDRDAIISCRKPAFFYLYSTRKTTTYSKTLDKEKVIEGLLKNNVDYVILDQLGYSSTSRYLYPAIKRYPAKFKVIKKTEKPEQYLMEFKPDLGYWGEWKDDKRNGTGTYTWENGNKYEGEWKNGRREGKGSLFLKNENVLSGTWVNDMMNGKFILRSKDGKIIEKAIYKNNRRTSILR